MEKTVNKEMIDLILESLSGADFVRTSGYDWKNSDWI